MAIGAVAIGEEAHWLQMGLQSQGRAFTAGRYQIQGEVCGQGILLEGRHRLQRGLLSHRQTYFHQSVAEHCSSSEFRAGADGCQDSIPPWAFGGEDLHGATTRFQGSRIRGKGLFAAEVVVRAEAVAEAMVQAVRLLLRSIGLFRCEFDLCVYVQSLEDGSRVFLLLYVDDMLIACKSRKVVQDLKAS